MLQAARTPLSAMDPATMLAVCNQLADLHGQPRVTNKAFDRFEVGKRIALMRATKPPVQAPAANSRKSRARDGIDKRRNRPALVRQVALEELAAVKYYINAAKVIIEAEVFEAGNFEGEWFSVGFLYSEVATRVRKRLPLSRITAPVLRRFVHHVRKETEGFKDVLLPELRPNPNRNKGVPNVNRTSPKRELHGQRLARDCAKRVAAKH